MNRDPGPAFTPPRTYWPRCVRRLALILALPAAVLAADHPPLSSAIALFEAKKFEEAKTAFEKIAADRPTEADAHFYLGELALRRGELEKATSFFEKATALSPTVSRYQRRLGDAWGAQAEKASVFRQLGLAKKCLAAYERAVALDPKDLDARQSLYEYYRQAPGLAGGGFDKALTQAKAIKEIDPYRGRIVLSRLYIGEKKYAEAFAEFDEVLKTQPDDYDALYQVGRTAAESGQSIDRGLASLRRCLELTPPARPGVPTHAGAHWRIGQLLEKKGDKAGARLAYEASLKLDASFGPAADALKKLK